MNSEKIQPSLPPEQRNAATWYGHEMAQRIDEWIIPLLRNEIVELEEAAKLWSVSQKTLAAMTAQEFPLPKLAPKLAKLREELIKGRGFSLLRGLPVGKYSEEVARIIFFGLGCHVGKAVSQNAQGHILGDVRDVGLRSSDPNVRVYQTNERQTFHTDSAGVVGLLCLKTAKSGGLSLLVSAAAIFNEMRKKRTDLLQILFQPIATDRRGEVPKGMLPYYLIPVFNYYQGYLSVVYQRQYIDSAQRFADAPRLSLQHIEALNMFDELADSTQLNFSMELQPGDMQFVYNYALLHDRTAFEDWPDIAQKRHLLRLWLAVPGDRPLPAIFASRFTSIEIGNIGGVNKASSSRKTPESDSKSPTHGAQV